MPSTSGNVTLNIDGIATDINNLSARIEELESNGGKVTLKGTRTTTGDWEITGLTVGKPLILVHDSTTSYNAGIYLKVVSGAVGGANSTSDSQGAYQMGRISNTVTGDVFIAIPTSTTVVINISTASATGFTVYAYQ